MSLFDCDDRDISAMAEEHIMEAMAALNTNLARLGANRVPPPAIFNGSTSVSTFFQQFEKYCTSIYGCEDKSTWLQILATFTDGEPRSIVQSFGTGDHITYKMVKDRVTAECDRRSLGSNKITDFYAATRRSKESLLCFSIRLQSLVGRMNEVPDGHKELMVKTKFVSCLKPATVRQISIRHGNDDVEFAELVRLAQLLENEDDNSSLTQTPMLPPVTSVPRPSLLEMAPSNAQHLPFSRNVARVSGANAGAVGPTEETAIAVTCYSCGEVGHYSRQCPTKNARAKCYECGVLGHLGRDCEVRRARLAQKPVGYSHHWRTNDQTGQSATSRQSQGRQGGGNVQTCGFCGAAHLFKDCPQFLQLVTPKCSWCGDATHASHECSQKPSGN